MARILIAEDDDVQRTLLRQLIEGEGHIVDTAPDGLVAEKLFRDHPADVVITDVFMPEQEGLGLIRELIKDYPDVKIIVLSAGEPSVNVDFLPVAKKLGAVRVYPKPVDTNELLAAINEILEAME